jgi:uncharacterized protein YjbJ (UPF0337 family)
MGNSCVPERGPEIAGIYEPFHVLGGIWPCNDIGRDAVSEPRDRSGRGHKDLAMSSTSDKIKGLANEAAGNVKQGIGNVTDNEKLKAEGQAQELKGDAQKTAGDVKDGAKHLADKVTGKN